MHVPSLTDEDIADIIAARNARSEESLSWEDAKAQLSQETSDRSE